MLLNDDLMLLDGRIIIRCYWMDRLSDFQMKPTNTVSCVNNITWVNTIASIAWDKTLTRVKNRVRANTITLASTTTLANVITPYHRGPLGITEQQD